MIKTPVSTTYLKTQPTATAITIDVPAATPALLASPSPRRFPILVFHHNPGHLWYGEEEAGKENVERCSAKYMNNRLTISLEKYDAMLTAQK